MISRTIWSASGLVAALAIATPAGAQSVDAARPETVVKALQDAGYKAVLGKDKSGDPKIDSAAAGASFHVFFYGCQQNANCRSIQFYSGYSFDAGKKPAPAKINDWNANNRFGTAYIDKDGDPNLQWDVVLAGGLPSPIFKEAIDHWTDAMGAFQQFVGWS